jgi:hypothetical protein
MKKGRLIQAEQDKRIKQLLGFIFNFRYATLRQMHTFIQLIMNLSYSRRLIAYCLKYDYLNAYYEPWTKTRIYYLTQKAKEMLSETEALIEYYHFEKSYCGINTFIHHNILIEVYFLLKSHLDIKEWLCEWVLRIGKKKKEKIPDALLILNHGAKIALEVETRYKKLAALKNFTAMYRYDIEKISRYQAVLITASSRLNFEGLKTRLFYLAPDLASRRFILSDIGMLEQGMCFYQNQIIHLDEAFRLLEGLK